MALPPSSPTPSSAPGPLRRFVAWSERRAHLPAGVLFRGGAWLTLGQLASAGVALGLTLIFANYLPKETYGLYKYALSIAGMLAIFTLPGIGTAVTRAAARDEDGTLRPATRTRIRWATAGSGLCLAAAAYYFFRGNVLLASMLLIIAVSLPFFETFATFNAHLLGKQQFRRSAQINIGIQVCATLAVICAMLVTRNILWILCAYFFSYAILRYVAYRVVVSRISPDAPADTQAVNYGKHLSAMNALSAVASNIDSLMLFHFLGPASVAIYGIVTAAPDQLKSLLVLAPSLFFPTLAREKKSQTRAAMPYRFLLSFVLSAAGIIVYLVLAPVFFNTLFPQYAPYRIMSQIFAISLLTVTFDPALIYLNSHRRIREQYWSTTLGNVMQIAAIVVLGALYGLWGIIWARVVVRILSNLLNVYFYYFPLSSSEPQQL